MSGAAEQGKGGGASGISGDARGGTDGGAPPEPTAAREIAVALRYADGDGAPRVTASGEGLVARNIEMLAEQAGVPLYRDPQLVKLLAEVDLGAEIPRALYVAVAEVIAFVWSLRADAEALPPRAGTRAAAGASDGDPGTGGPHDGSRQADAGGEGAEPAGGRGPGAPD